MTDSDFISWLAAECGWKESEVLHEFWTGSGIMAKAEVDTWGHPLVYELTLRGLHDAAEKLKVSVKFKGNCWEAENGTGRIIADTEFVSVRRKSRDTAINECLKAIWRKASE